LRGALSTAEWENKEETFGVQVMKGGMPPRRAEVHGCIVKSRETESRASSAGRMKVMAVSLGKAQTAMRESHKKRHDADVLELLW